MIIFMVYWDFLVANTSGFSSEIWAFPMNVPTSAGAARRPDLPEMWHGASRLGAPALPKRHGNLPRFVGNQKKTMGSPRFPRVSHYLYLLISLVLYIIYIYVCVCLVAIYYQ